ncbi:hypothetical protein HDU87_006661 [Geranomyces variabilis]|uniref:Uncharacterized protein n=1 Tax=Geranomyces variabilis TaxID=109894 RepID=A0AAD5TG53_9FUNG|nr:hypothetical protein HDU87_006661 [Geranomyces variabilis]
MRFTAILLAAVCLGGTLAFAAPYLSPDLDELVLQTSATSIVAPPPDQDKLGDRPYRSCDATGPPVRAGSFDSPRIKDLTAGTFESWHFDIALIQNSTKFFFAWHASDPLYGGFDPQLIVEFTLPDGTHHTSVTKGDMEYQHDETNGYSLSIGESSFTWTDDAKWYKLNVKTENFLASLTYENMLPLAFVPRQYDESFAILPHFNVIVPIPRAHVDGWVQFASGERWAIQNVGFHDHRWGQHHEANKGYSWSLLRAHSWNVTVNAIMVTNPDGKEKTTASYLAHFHEPLYSLWDSTSTSLVPSLQLVMDSKPLTGYVLDYNVCDESGHYHLAALQEISTECAPTSGKRRISLGLTGLSIRDYRVTEKVDWGVGYIEQHHKCTMQIE